MYQVIEYNDYRKEVYIRLHGITRDLPRAEERAQDILAQKASRYRNEEDATLYQVYKLPKHHRTDYVALQDQDRDRKTVISQYTYREIMIAPLLGKLISDLFVQIERNVPSALSEEERTQPLTKSMFQDLLARGILREDDLLCLREAQEIDVDDYSTIVAIVSCEEF